MARNATFRGANLQYIAAPKSLTGLSDVTVASAANLDRLQYSTSAGKWVDVAALTTPQIEDSSADHQYVFAVSELAADRTVTLPLLTGNDTFVFNAFAATLTNKTLTSPVLNTGVSGSAVLDQDDMSGNSATQLATQQSIKAYVDAQVATEDTLAELNDTTISGPASNDVLQYSGSAWEDRTYAEAGIVSLTGSETLTNKTITSPVLNGGALTALTDLDMTSGDKTILDTIGSNTLTIGASGTTVTIPGNLTVTGTQTTVSTTNTLIADKLLTLNDGGSASSGTGVGIEVEEDSSATGYIKTAADRAGWEIKAPSTAGVLTIDPSANSNTIAFGGSGKTFTISETATIDQDLATTANVTHANLTATGNVSLGNAASDTVTITGTLQGASPLVFEGGTANAYETTLAITDPTADRTWTLPDATDTFVGLATADSLSNKTLASPVITTGDINTPDIDGGTVDAITSLTVANNVDVGSYTVRASGFLADGLTAGQVVYTGTDGVLTSEAALAYNAGTNTLTATTIAGTLSTAAQANVTSLGALTGLTVSGDTFVSNGSGLVVGHSAQVTAGAPFEFQVLGTGQPDSGMTIGHWATVAPAELGFVSGPGSTIGAVDIVSDDHPIGVLRYYAADGVDLSTLVAEFGVEVDDSSPGAGDIGAAFYWKLETAGTDLRELMRLTSSGQFLLGHDAPLRVSTGDGSSSADPHFQRVGTGGDNSKSLFASFSTTATRAGASQLAFAKGGSATVGVGTVVTDDEVLGAIIAYGDDGTDLKSPAAAIEFAVDGTPGTGDMPGRMVFSTTADGGETLTERMRIDSDGVAFMPEGGGLVVGSTARITTNNGVDEFQVLGTGSADGDRAAMVIGRWSANNAAPGLEFMKSRHATIGSHSPVLDNDRLAEIKFVADVNNEFNTLAAMLRVEVDDASPAQHDTGAAYVFFQAGGGGVSLRETMRLDAAGNLAIAGSASHGTAVGSGALSLFNATAPTGTLTNGASFYCASGEMNVIDAAGNVTLLSPHDDEGRWIYRSKSDTGKTLVVHMEQLVRRLEEEFGWGFVQEFTEREGAA